MHLAEEDYEVISYQDIKEIRSEVDSLRGKKDISTKDLYDTIQKFTNTMSGMLTVFRAAADQLKLEGKDLEVDTKKHNQLISKLDKLIDQNKTIADGMISIVDVVKDKIPPQKEEDKDDFFGTQKAKPIQQRQEWPFQQSVQTMQMPKQDIPADISQQINPFNQFNQSTNPEPQQIQQIPTPPPIMPTIPIPELSSPLPLEPASQDLNFPEEPFGLEEPKKKGLFGMFKK